MKKLFFSTVLLLILLLAGCSNDRPSFDRRAVADLLQEELNAHPELTGATVAVMRVKDAAVILQEGVARDSAGTFSALNPDSLLARQVPMSLSYPHVLMPLLDSGKIHLTDRLPADNGILPGLPQDDHAVGLKEVSIYHGLEISMRYVFYKLSQDYGVPPPASTDMLTALQLYNAIAARGICRGERICTRETADTLAHALWRINRFGTDESPDFSGKHGSQLIEKDGKPVSTAAFAGFFPVENPEFTMLVSLSSGDPYLMSGRLLPRQLFEKIMNLQAADE